MDKIGIFDETSDGPENFLALSEEEDTIDLDVLSKSGEWEGTLLQIDKETLRVSTYKNLCPNLEFETNREGELEIYEAK